MRTPDQIRDGLAREKSGLEEMLVRCWRPRRSQANRRQHLKATIYLTAVDFLLSEGAWKTHQELNTSLDLLREMRVNVEPVQSRNVVHSIMMETVDELSARYTATDDPTARPLLPTAWEEEKVRAHLTFRIHLQKSALAYFKHRKTLSDPEREAEDNQHAELAVLERFLFSNHLFSREAFLHGAKIIREEGGPFHTSHDANRYKEEWRQSLDKLAQELAAGYV